MKVLICGGREANADEVAGWLMRNSKPDWDTVIHGAARGTDSAAGNWAVRAGINVVEYPADWNGYGRRAGPIRNQRMLSEGRPDLVVAFPGGRGTADMVRRAEKAKVKVIRAAI